MSDKPGRTRVNETCSRIDKGRVIIVTELESCLAVLVSFSSTLLKIPSPERQRSLEHSLDKESCSLDQ
jgi:hypothetical protein